MTILNAKDNPKQSPLKLLFCSRNLLSRAGSGTWEEDFESVLTRICRVTRHRKAVPQSRQCRAEGKVRSKRPVAVTEAEKKPRKLNFVEQYIRTHRKRKRKTTALGKTHLI